MQNYGPPIMPPTMPSYGSGQVPPMQNYGPPVMPNTPAPFYPPTPVSSSLIHVVYSKSSKRWNAIAPFPNTLS